MIEPVLSESPTADPIEILKSVLTASHAVRDSLDPLDLAAFGRAIAVRAAALEALGPALDKLHAPGGDDSARRQMASLSKIILDLEDTNRELATAGLEFLRNELSGIRDGKQALQGYRVPPAAPPQFADRRG